MRKLNEATGGQPQRWESLGNLGAVKADAAAIAYAVEASFSGHRLDVGGGGISPGQELVEAAVGVAVDNAGDDVGQVGVRLDANQLAGLDERGDHGPMFGPAVGAGEQGILSLMSWSLVRSQGSRSSTRCRLRSWRTAQRSSAERPRISSSIR
jgi:hypothetical protein